MLILIAGATHTGKTLLAQKLMERLAFPYLSIDHLKMGLIRAGHTALTPQSPEAELTAYLWPVLCEIIKTSIENRQNLIVEGCYIPFDFSASFPEEYLRDIHYTCLILSERYINEHAEDIFAHANAIEHRMADNGLCREAIKAANRHNLELCRHYGLKHLLIEEAYDIAHLADEAMEQLGC